MWSAFSWSGFWTCSLDRLICLNVKQQPTILPQTIMEMTSRDCVSHFLSGMRTKGSAGVLHSSDYGNDSRQPSCERYQHSRGPCSIVLKHKIVSSDNGDCVVVAFGRLWEQQVGIGDPSMRSCVEAKLHVALLLAMLFLSIAVTCRHMLSFHLTSPFWVQGSDHLTIVSPNPWDLHWQER